MSSKKWVITFIITFLLIIGGYAAFNILVDPFGLFGDVIYDWYSYDMTINPRAAKIGYLDKNHKNYDSYIIGCSSTSSFPVEALNKYFGGKFYNLFMYGADMLDVEQTCEYIIKNYDVKNLIVNVALSNTSNYDVNNEALHETVHAKVSKTPVLSFLSRYMFLKPEHSLEKIKLSNEDKYLPEAFDVFIPETGAYDKTARDAEPIRSLEDYYEAYPVFTNYPYSELPMDEIDTTVESVKRIKQLCEENDINVQFISAAIYSEHLKCFSEEKVKEFFTKLANVTPYWSFATNSLTDEPRFFYDATHLRNALGTMAVAKMAGANDIWMPDDVGTYVTKDNVSEYIMTLWNTEDNRTEYVAKVPVLMYHSIAKVSSGYTVVSEKEFSKHMTAIKLAGFNTVTVDDLINYVEKGIELPRNPICITFDDGYLDNYEIAYPILKKHNMKATMFVIGSSVGSNGKYKDTEYNAMPHFSYEQAKEMIDSGLISIQSHTYDMHQWEEFEESEAARVCVAQLENETEEEYIEVLRKDAQKIKDELHSNLGIDTVAMAYPTGVYNTLSNAILSQEGIKVTFSVEEGVNELVKGLPQSLYSLKRFNMTEGMNLLTLLNKVRR